jgi:hypothetical protein
MSMNKKLLAAAIAGLLVAGNAGAVVLGTDPARIYAVEIVNGTTLTDVNDDVETKLGYNFSDGEVRYGRLECSPNVTLSNPVITEVSPNISLGVINGAGTNALFFSITAANSVAPAAMPATANDVLSLDSDVKLLDKGAVTCQFSIYDQPSQAQAGLSGPGSGQIASTGFKPFIARGKSFAFTTNDGESIADVQATPSYTKFVSNDRDFGSLTFGFSPDAAAGKILDKDGSTILLSDIFAASTKVQVAGTFNAASSVAWVGDAASTLTVTDATWTGAELDLGVDGVSGALTYNENGTTEIEVSAYKATLDVTTNAGYEAVDEELANVGDIIRNGTRLQAPLVQLPGGHLSRMVLTNTGTMQRKYTIKVYNEVGNVVGKQNLTGFIQPESTLVVDLNTVLTSFTGSPRATIVVTVDAPNNDIQGLYQIVNTDKGAISNHVMVRPGSN